MFDDIHPMARKTEARGSAAAASGRHTPADVDGVAASSFLWSTTVLAPSTAVAVALFALLIRLLVSLGPYSGQGTPSMYGDYEAQRHWMEITLHTPTAEWYRNTAANNLSYWGLDYPPLTAYQSLAHAFLINASIPESLALSSSRGFESHKSKLAMRWTVLSSDLLVLFPAAIYFVSVYFRRNVGGDAKGRSSPWFLAMILLNPCLILIDHGHFQYNCISLGLTLGAIAAILSQKEITASILFCLAINHKQMSLYYAPAFFSHLLGKCFRRKNPIFEVLKLGLVVIGIFALVWWPYIHSVQSVMEVIHRLAPFERGVFEDYVANFWCSTSMLIKWKRIFTISTMRFICSIATILAFFPSFVQQIKSPSDLGFLYSLLNSSFSFYLFSYQVHEKSILLPLLPASLLALQEPTLFGWLINCSLLSMYPLVCRDKLSLQYGSVLALFALIFYAPHGKQHGRVDKSSTKRVALLTVGLICSAVLHLVYLGLEPPKRYPFLFEALIMSFCFSQFVIYTVYTNIKQWMLLDHSSLKMRVKKDS
ncbi:probable dolichyl pyrophosphate Man9GlcNAc2 alpha-1,3-glucosyltransferase [Zingiber officinale]|uniref:probable dolichyl pyrophosphate Man9GlcNAc2 alpha-1,3-glucosyltransferase n=1 Tax=Zingiber officinale TaxID=94328 RepID=UPI001C4B1A6C|nr:probable dolichyl pyrophosphate Man9GlcNAc2 alpha-1,3-glucosyltransferase [Zingiber officinale]